MFIGHYAAGFVLKKKAADLPLWLLFVAVQFVDILAFLFILLGIEKISYNPSPNPFLRTILDYVPYSHSLTANALLSLGVFLAFRKFKNKQWALVLAIGVFSHWFIDALVHAGDMPLFHDSLKVGLGLWNFPQIAFVGEMLMFLLAAYYLLRAQHKMVRHLVLILFGAAGFSAMFFAPQAEATPQMASIVSLSLYALFAGLAYWCEMGTRRSDVLAEAG